ncbi:hypothetical protein [Streptomyces echinatus]|uniref:Thioesterase family protein n=1 Tax=Streptomyces echinatus TaxID=67293 RepID=A0A7W9Q1T9_9ACTN|nr:hypothetical protein [Streptomyces echinatus]MBB5932045.1 hypothetical protein [Streptomyces echinatus]
MRIPARYNGPPGTANGGYACGAFAGLAAGHQRRPVAVTLLGAPRLDHALEFRPGARRSQIWDGDRLIATMTTSAAEFPAVEAVPLRAAAEASARYRGRVGHPFPTCFVCGPNREPADGFPVAPGEVAGSPGVVACPWTPTAASSDRPELVWSVLDCPGGWTTDPVREPMVLTRMIAVLRRPPRPPAPHVVVARRWRRQGRTATVGTALYDDRGELVAKATALWTAVGVQEPADVREQGDLDEAE